MQYFDFPNKEVITHRCNGKTVCLYKKQYFFRYETDSEYKYKTIGKNINRSNKCKVRIKNSESDFIEFSSFKEALRYFNLPETRQIKTEKIKRFGKNNPFTMKIKDFGVVLEIVIL